MKDNIVYGDSFMPRSYVLSEKQKIAICEEYKNGSNGYEIAEKYSVTPPAVYSILRIRNVIRRDSSDYRKYHCNDHFFDKIDTEEKAYWLGFMEADKWIDKKTNRIHLGLVNTDRNHLKKFLTCIKSDHKIFEKTTFNKKYNKFYFSSYITIHSKQMKKMLLKHKNDNYSLIPDKLMRHFIRGLFDGDGGVCQYTKNSTNVNFNIRIHFFIVEKIQEYLIQKLNFNKTKIDREFDVACRLRYSGKKQLKKFYNFIYKDANMWLDRKQEKFLIILNH